MTVTLELEFGKREITPDYSARRFWQSQWVWSLEEFWYFLENGLPN